MRNFKICLIEDDQAFLYLAKIIIQSVDSNLDVVSFTDGAKGYEFIEKNKADKDALADIIFLDLNMPCMDGWEFLDAYAKIKDQISKSTTIYLLSSSISEKDINRANGIPLVKDFLTKPLEESKLKEILNEHRV